MLAGPVVRPAIAQAARPEITHGVMSGDVETSRGMIWSRARTGRRACMWNGPPLRALPTCTASSVPAALEPDDFTAKLDLANLPAGQDIFYRVTFQDLSDVNVVSHPVVGSFRTAPAAAARHHLRVDR